MRHYRCPAHWQLLFTFCHSESSSGVSLAFRLLGGTYAGTAFAVDGADVAPGAGLEVAFAGAGGGATRASPPSFSLLFGSYSAPQHTHSLGLAASTMRGVPRQWGSGQTSPSMRHPASNLLPSSEDVSDGV